MDKKILFTLQPHSVVDVITNSSSELFVGKNQSKEDMIALITAVYPNYLNEYEELKTTQELSCNELDTYFSYACSPMMWPASKSMYPVLKGFTFDELYELEVDYKTKEIKLPAWNGEMQYRLRTNDFWRFVTESNVEEMKAKLDSHNEMYFLFSLDENPNWDFQEELMNIMNRFHLG